MALFLGLYLGHILGDFVFQPGRLVIAKREHPAAAVLHTAIVTACTAVVLASSIRSVWPAVLAVGAAHLGVEQLSIRARRVPGSTGLTVFLLDQGLHVVSLVAISMLAGLDPEPSILIWQVPVETLAAVCAIATVAFGGSILVFEFQLARAELQPGPARVLRLDASRLYGIAERGGALLSALLLPVPVIGALAFVPRIAYALLFRRDSKAEHLTAAFVGLGMAAFAWALVTSVIRFAN